MTNTTDKPRDPYSLRVAAKDLPPLSRSHLWLLFDVAWPHRFRFLIMLFFVGLGVLTGVPQPLVTKEIIDGISPPATTFPSLTLWVGLFAGLVVVSQAGSLARGYFQTRFRQAVSTTVRTRVLDHVLRLPPRFFDREETGYLMSRVFGDTQYLEGLVSSQILSLVLDLVKFAGGVAILFFLHAKLALIAFAMLPALVLTVKLFRRKVGILSDRQMEITADFFKNLQEAFSGIWLVKAAGREGAVSARLAQGIRRIFGAEIRTVLVSSLSSAFMAIVTSAGILAVIWYGASEVLAQRLTVGGLVAFQAYLVYLYGPSRSLMRFPIMVQPALIALRRISVLLAMEPERKEGGHQSPVRGKISFEGVTFAYADGPTAIEDLSFTVGVGEKLGVAGPSGAGKSTLAKLLLGFYRPQKGRVTVDGVDVNDWNPAALRQGMGYLLQEAFFFSDTFRGNLSWARPDVKEEELLSALDAAGLKELLANLPQGLDTPVGERGLNLSGGERQRLAIARALVEDPPVLVLDESTSYLDKPTEAEVQKNLYARYADRTVLVVAHRLSTLQGLDRILVLSKGRMAQEGRLEDLLAQEGPLHDLLGQE